MSFRIYIYKLQAYNIQQSIVYLMQKCKTKIIANFAKIHIEIRKNEILIFPNF